MEEGTPGKKTSAALPAAAADHLLVPFLVVSWQEPRETGPVPALLGAGLAVRSPEPAAGSASQSELDRWKPGCDRDGLPTQLTQNGSGWWDQGPGPGRAQTPACLTRSQEPRDSESTTLRQVRPFRALPMLPPGGVQVSPTSPPQGPEAGHFGAKPATRARINRVDSIKWIFPDWPPC